MVGWLKGWYAPRQVETESVYISEHKMGMESGLLDNNRSVKASISKSQMTFLKSVTFMIWVNWQRVCGVIRVDAR